MARHGGLPWDAILGPSSRAYKPQPEASMTAFVPRPAEHGPGETKDLAPERDYDVVADDLVALADMLA